MNPTIAPTPSQYQYAWVKKPLDFKTATPRGSVEFGRTWFYEKVNLKIRQLLKKNNPKVYKAVYEYYMSPISPKKLIN